MGWGGRGIGFGWCFCLCRNDLLWVAGHKTASERAVPQFDDDAIYRPRRSTHLGSTAQENLVKALELALRCR